MSDPDEVAAPVPRCVVCSRPLAPDEVQSCLRCLGRVRRELARVPELVALLPWGFDAPVSQRLDSGRGSGERALPGGDALVMLGPGSDARDPGARRDDPPAVLFELDRWCVDWAELRDEASPWPVSLSGACSWLSVRAGWAAGQHPAFEEFADDLARMVSRLESVTASGDRPVRGAPCFECGADLERRWTDEGLADEFVCPRCRRCYDMPSYWLAVRARLEEERGRMGAC